MLSLDDFSPLTIWYPGESTYRWFLTDLDAREEVLRYLEGLKWKGQFNGNPGVLQSPGGRRAARLLNGLHSRSDEYFMICATFSDVRHVLRRTNSIRRQFDGRLLDEFGVDIGHEIMSLLFTHPFSKN